MRGGFRKKRTDDSVYPFLFLPFTRNVKFLRVRIITIYVPLYYVPIQNSSSFSKTPDFSQERDIRYQERFQRVVNYTHSHEVSCFNGFIKKLLAHFLHRSYYKHRQNDQKLYKKWQNKRKKIRAYGHKGSLNLLKYCTADSKSLGCYFFIG
jgi:hypothetical protein